MCRRGLCWHWERRRGRKHVFARRGKVVGGIAHQTSFPNTGMALARSEFVHLMSEAAGLQKGLVSSAGAKVGIGSHELNESVRGLPRWLGEELEGKALRS